MTRSPIISGTLGSALALAGIHQYSDLRAAAPEGADVGPEASGKEEMEEGSTAPSNGQGFFGWAQKIMCVGCRRDALLDAAESGDLDRVQVSSCPSRLVGTCAL